VAQMTPKGKKRTLHDLTRDPLETESYFKELSGESDRGAALIAAAALSSGLIYLLSTLFTTLSKQGRDKLFYANNATLGTFSSQIEIAYALGCITKPERHILDIVRNVRNAFAYSVSQITFSTKEVLDECNKLKAISTISNYTDTKSLYVYSALAVNIEIMTRANGIVVSKQGLAGGNPLSALISQTTSLEKSP
jgi:hypothetical protein